MGERGSHTATTTTTGDDASHLHRRPRDHTYHLHHQNPTTALPTASDHHHQLGNPTLLPHHEEQKASEAVAMRSEVQKEMMMKEKEWKEQELRALARKARSERTGAAPPPAAVPLPSDKRMVDDADMMGDHERVKEKDIPKETKEERKQRLEREKIREERERERERERRLEQLWGRRVRLLEIETMISVRSSLMGWLLLAKEEEVRLHTTRDCLTKRRGWIQGLLPMTNTMCTIRVCSPRSLLFQPFTGPRKMQMMRCMEVQVSN